MSVSKALYKPLSIATSVAGGLVAGKTLHRDLAAAQSV